MAVLTIKRRCALGKATTDRCSTPPAVHQRQERQKHAKTVATRCHRLPETFMVRTAMKEGLLQ